MNKKCTKYEGLFIFADKETLENHLKECPDCQAEQAEMDKVSDLIQEVKFHYQKRKSNLKVLKIACALFLMLCVSSIIGILNQNPEFVDILVYGTELTPDDLGLPTDSYGLITVD